MRINESSACGAPRPEWDIKIFHSPDPLTGVEGEKLGQSFRVLRFGDCLEFVALLGEWPPVIIGVVNGTCHSVSVWWHSDSTSGTKGTSAYQSHCLTMSHSHHHWLPFPVVSHSHTCKTGCRAWAQCALSRYLPSVCQVPGVVRLWSM